jgi:thiamine transport system substrate-binding protein
MTTKGADNPLAKQFLDFMLSPGFQDVIPETNWMLPAGATDKPLPAAFGKIVAPEKTLLFTPAEVNANRRAWIDEWLNAVSK